jgi:light-regulated signal transduction histidine kinase (bacteriophytochrome)
MIPESEREEMTNRLNACFVDGKEYEMEHRLIMPDGTIKWVHAKAIPVLDSEGKTISVRGVTQDITEEKKKEEELKKVYATIEEQNKRLLNFAHIVTHNLRSHSANLIKVTEILEEADSEEERNEMTGFVKKLGQSLYETINSLNEIVQIQLHPKLQKETLHFDKVYSKILNVLQASIKEKKATIMTDFSGCPVIDSVPSYLESILLNFTTNAIKYSHPDRAPFIKIKATIEDGRKVLLIEDNGLGIDLAQYGDKLFGMYKTFHGNPDARGVGLFITKNQIDALGGDIKVSSELNVGTTFKILF